MTLEQQVVSLDLAKRLKELGVGQNSLFYWHSEDHCKTYSIGIKQSETAGWSSDVVSAFTVAELGEMLKEYELECIWFPEHEKWGAFQTCSGIEPLFADNEADARASLLIYLLESNLLPASHRG